MRVQNLITSLREYNESLFHRRGWADSKKFPWHWELQISRHINGSWFRCMMTVGGEDTQSIRFSLGLLWFKFYLTLDKFLPKSMEVGWYSRGDVKNTKWFEDSHGRDIGIYLFENHLVFRWWSSNMGWSSDGSFGYFRSIFVDEFIFGRRTHSSVVRKTVTYVEAQLPEATYHLDIILTNDTWKYKRFPWWPLTRTIHKANTKVVETSGIPIPGKGENSWDCGDNALYEQSCVALTTYEAKKSFIQSVIDTRDKYGGGINMYVKKEKQ